MFGKLLAIQKIKDESGNNIKIPLKNVPVGVFAPSNTFSDATDVDENGSRISLNVKQGSDVSDYFNAESFSADTQQFLQDASNFTQVPSHYKYMTYTNDEGEFVIHNVPVGTQTVIFEVDMFKQGLTKDEIALNFFPFPADPEPNIDTVPSFFFRQFPIDVVPTWGDFQTGYTEVNITTNLDLRKWSTYFVPPTVMDNKTIEDLQSQGIPSPIQVQIRDMATEGFPIRNIEMVEIPDIRNREENQQLMWRNEIKQLKNRVEIRRNGWQAFKLPANCYDPRGYRTDREGIPTGDRGVWLAAYQMKLFYDQPTSIYRTTGSRTIFNEQQVFARRDHFHLNYSYENFEEQSALNAAATEGVSVGVFPYEKPWNHDYPEPYSIPKLPTQENPDYYNEMGDNGEYVLEHPLYTDGDRIGHPFTQEFRDNGFGGGTGGYGVEPDVNSGAWFKNDFSRLVAKNTYYRYENRGNRSEEYANGYKPNIDTFPAQPGVSSVVNGEKYQRTECGYGYFMRPEGWARTAIYSWWGISEATFGRDLVNPNGVVTPEQGSQGAIISKAPHFNSMSIVSDNTGQKVSLNIGAQVNSYVKTGYLDLYRIVNSNPNENLNPIQLGEIITQTKYIFGPTRIQNAHTSGNRKPQFKANGSNQDEWNYASNLGSVNQGTVNNAKLFVQNLGVKRSKIKFGNGSEFNLAPGQGIELSLFEIAPNWSNVEMTAEGNVNFDYEQRIYTDSLYGFQFRNVNFYRSLTSSGSQNLRKTNTYNILSQYIPALPLDTGPYNTYLHSTSRDVKTRSNAFGSQRCNGGSYQNTANIRCRGSYWDGANNKRHVVSYWSSASPYELTCTTEDGGYQIISTSTIESVFNNAVSGDLQGVISGLANLLDDIF